MIAKWLDDNSIEAVIAFTYASAKGFIFEMFFGWRQTKHDKVKFLFSKRDWKNIDTMVKYYYKYVNKEENNEP